MSKEVEWNNVILEEFMRIAILTDEEELVLLDHVKGRSRVWIHMERHMSLSKVDKIISRLKKKYDSAQEHSDILPKRELLSKV